MAVTREDELIDQLDVEEVGCTRQPAWYATSSSDGCVSLEGWLWNTTSFAC